MEIGEISGYMNINNQFLQGRNSVEDSRFNDVLRRAEETQAKVNAAGNNTHSNPSSAVPIDKTDKLYELCLELETFLVKNLINSMRSTVQKSGLIDQGFAGKMYEDMLYDEYAKDFTKNAKFGLAEQAYLQLQRNHL